MEANSAEISAHALNLISSNSTEFETVHTNRKKSKKRDRSPSAAAEPSGHALKANNAQTGETESNEVNSNATSTAASTAVNAQKKEKQRPETWNKIEQQIFFNALRQVITFLALKRGLF